MTHSLIFPLGTFLEGASVVNALSTFAPLSEATALYGIMSGVVAPVVSMPSVVSSSFCSWLLPRLCSTSPQNRRSTFSKYARFPLVFSALASLTLVIFSKEILAFLYSLHGPLFYVFLFLGRVTSRCLVKGEGLDFAHNIQNRAVTGLQNGDNFVFPFQIVRAANQRVRLFL